MTTAIIEALKEEIAFISSILEYSDEQELVELVTMDEAKQQAADYINSYAPDIPGSLADPETMMMAWNAAVRQEKTLRHKRQLEKQDDEIARMNPDCLRFRAAYEDGTSAFFDPDQLTHDLIRTGYDEVHWEIIAKALMAYLKK